VVATVNVENFAHSAAYDAGKGEVFVTNSGGNTVSVISDSSGGGLGIPEFPVQLGFALLVTAIVVASYASVRRGFRIDKQPPIAD